MSSTVILELKVDARQSAPTLAEHARLLAAAEKVAMGLSRTETLAAAAIEKTIAPFMRASSGGDRLARSLDALRARVDPLVRAEQELTRAAATLDAGFQRGLITEQEVIRTMDLLRAKQAAAAIGFAGAGAAATTSAQGAQTAAFAFQDLGAQLASGNVSTMALINSGQLLATTFGGGTGGVAGVLKGAGAGLLAFITNPVNLAIAGFAILASVAIPAIKAIFDRTEDTAAVTERLTERVERLRDAYGEAAKAQIGLTDTERFEMTLDAQADLLSSTRALTAATVDLIAARASRPTGIVGLDMMGGSDSPLLGDLGNGEQFDRLEQAARALFETMAAGAPDFETFKQELLAINAEADDPALSAAAGRIWDLVQPADAAATRVARLEAQIAVLNGTATNAQYALLGLGTAMDRIVARIPELAAAQRQQGELAAQAADFSSAMADIDAQLASGGFDNAAPGHGYYAAVDELTERNEAAILSITGVGDAVEDAFADSGDWVREGILAEMAPLDRAIAQVEANASRLRVQTLTAIQQLEDTGYGGGETGDLAALNAQLDDIDQSTERQIAALRASAVASTASGGAASAMADDFADATKAILDQITALALQGESLGLTADETARLRAEQDLMKAAMADGTATAAEIAMIDELIGRLGIAQDEYAKLKLEQDAADKRKASLAEAFDFALDAARSFADGTADVYDLMVKAAKAASDKLASYSKEQFSAGNTGLGILGALGSVLFSFIGKMIQKAKEQKQALESLNEWAATGGRDLTATEQNIQKLGNLIEAMGRKAKDAGPAIDALMAQFRADFSSDLQGRINELLGKGWLTDMGSAIDDAALLLNDALALGLDTTNVGRYFALQAQSIVDGAEVTGAAFDELITMFPDLAGVVHEFSGDLAASMDEINGIGGSILEWVQGQLGGSESTASPQDTLTAARAAYDRQLALARGGNADAQGSITQYADDLLAAAREMYASTAAFQDIRSEILAALTGLPAVQTADDPVVVALRETVTELLGGFGTVVEALDAIDINDDGIIYSIERSIYVAGLTRTDVVRAIGGGPATTATLLKPFFSSLDKNIDGVLTFTEIKTALGPLATNAQITALITAVDKNKNGVIEAVELAEAAVGTVADNTDDALTLLEAVRTQTSQTTWLADQYFGPMTESLELIAEYSQLTAKATDPQYQGILGRMRARREARQAEQAGSGLFATGGIIPSYASGGMVGNGMFGVDSVLARYAGGGAIGLAGGEGILTASTTAALGGAPAIAAMNAGRGLNDNGRYFADLMAANRRDTMDIMRMYQAGVNAQVLALRDEMGMLRSEVRELRKTGERQPARVPGTNRKAA